MLSNISSNMQKYIADTIADCRYLRVVRDKVSVDMLCIINVARC